MKRIVKWKNDANEVQLTGNVYYINSLDGSDSYHGLCSAKALQTQAYAESIMNNGDILIKITSQDITYPTVGRNYYHSYKLDDTMYYPNNAITSREEILELITGDTYYLDSSAGEGGNGSESTPWNNLSDALSGISSGDLLLIADGNYGTYNADTQYVNWVIFMNKEGHNPRFYSAYKTSSSTVKTANMIFYGIKFLPMILICITGFYGTAWRISQRSFWVKQGPEKALRLWQSGGVGLFRLMRKKDVLPKVSSGHLFQ